MELGRRDIRLDVSGNQLRYDAPCGALTPEIRNQLSQCKKQLLEFLTLGRWLVEAPLSAFAECQCLIEIAVPGLKETTWLVSGRSETRRLIEQGIHRGRIWTAAEMFELSCCESATDREISLIAKLKLATNAEVESVANHSRSSRGERLVPTKQLREGQ